MRRGRRASARAAAGCRGRRAACARPARSAAKTRSRCFLGQPAEVELVVVAQEVRPLAARRQLRVSRSAFDERPHVAGRERVEEVLVDPEVEHHVHAVACSPKYCNVSSGSTFASPSRMASPQRHWRKSRSSSRYSKWSCGCFVVRRAFLDDERHRVDAEAGDAELQPEAHDAPDLLADGRVLDVEVGLEVVEAVEVVLARLADRTSTCLLHAGEDHALVPRRRPLLRPHVPVEARRVRRLARASLEPGVLGRRCG